MAMHELTLKSMMEELDGGRVAEAFMAEVRRVAMDCDDRPGDDKSREVTLKFLVQPLCDEQGHLESIVGKFRVASTVPQRKSKAYSFAFKKGGKLAFNDMSDGNVNQMTFE